MAKKPNILYVTLIYTVTIVGSCWLIYLSINDFNRGILEQKKYSSNKLPVELLEASKLKAMGNVGAAEQVLNAFIVENPDSYEGRLMLSELYYENCIKDTIHCDLALWNLTFLIEKFPQKNQPLIYRSDVYYKLGDTLSAERDLKKIRQ